MNPQLQRTPSMRAVEYDCYGTPEVLTVRNVPRPEPGGREVLVRVHGAAVNPADTKIRSGAMKLMSGQKFPKRTGVEFSGEIVAVGPKADGVTVGLPVWGFLGDISGKTGTAAEFVTVDVGAVGPAPATIDLLQAAALPTGGVTALLALRDALKVAPGHELLVVGASGGVGSAAIQLGAAMGAKVTAVASPTNHDLCRGLGAAHVFDYTDPPGVTGTFDAVLDCHGTALGTYRRLLRRRGRMLSTDPRGMQYAMLSTLLPGPRVRLIMAKSRRTELAALTEYVDSGRLRPVIDDLYPLHDIAKVHQLTEAGHARGKRLIALDND